MKSLSKHVIVEFYTQNEKYRPAVRKVLRQKKVL